MFYVFSGFIFMLDISTNDMKLLGIYDLHIAAAQNDLDHIWQRFRYMDTLDKLSTERSKA